MMQSSGTRLAWERQQLIAALKKDALKIPSHQCCKPLLLATHLHSILTDLTEASHGAGIATAAASLQQLARLDHHVLANQNLILCFLLRAGLHPIGNDSLGLWHSWRVEPGNSMAALLHFISFMYPPSTGIGAKLPCTYLPTKAPFSPFQCEYCISICIACYETESYPM